jgi:histidinol dehydrogenase
MATLKIVQTGQADFEAQWRQLRQKLTLESALLDNTLRLEQVRKIVAQVRTNGDEAVAELTAKFDRVELIPEEFRISEQDLKQAHKRMNAKLLEALRQSITNVREYQEAIKVQQIADWTRDGTRLGVRYRPIRRVGVCVPGWSAPLVSTVIMTAVPAQVAGVKEIAVISAPKPEHNNSIHPDIMGVCWELGLTEVFRISGAQAVAALAFGTDTIPKADKIVGPSSWWGQIAKKEVYGLVDIDSFAGPSEVLILADDSANPTWVAADMLSQAEHAPGSAVLLTDSSTLADTVAQELDKQLAELGRSEETRSCVTEFCRAIVTRDMDELVRLANEFAAEHLQVQCQDSDAIAERIVNAGAIFIGHYTPVATGDYFAGPSHTLPTGGSAKFFSALNVNDFVKQTSIIHYDEQALKNAADSITRIAQAEGLDAHAKSVSKRVDS